MGEFNVKRAIEVPDSDEEEEMFEENDVANVRKIRRSFSVQEEGRRKGGNVLQEIKIEEPPVGPEPRRKARKLNRGKNKCLLVAGFFIFFVIIGFSLYFS